MLTVYGRPTSINVRKVLWCAAELGLPFDHVGADGARGQPPTADFTSLNPNAKIPVIDDDGFVLWESNAICRYLAARAGRDDLLPGDIAARARVEQWMDWQTTDLNASWRYAYFALVLGTPAQPDPAALAASLADWHRHMTMLEMRLAATGGYVAGDQFTLADLVLGTSTWRWLRTPMERPALKAIERWYGRLASRPAFIAQRWGDAP
jgi:glutathione S-transferase